MIDGHWLPVTDGDPRASYLYERHYSCVNLMARRRRSDKRICGPGEHILLMTVTCDALFGWRRCSKPDLAGQMGVCCFVFRNEGRVLSSKLILEAEQIARQRWPSERFYTYVNPGKIKTGNPQTGIPNPGKCFVKAGWLKLEQVTGGGLLIFEKLPEATNANS